MKKSQAIANRISTKMFDFRAKTQTFFADVSELAHEKLDAFDQLWHDEGVQGFVMVSAKTGKEVPFELVHTEREADGDTRAWQFKPHSYAIGLDSRLADVSVIVFNT